MGGLFYKMKSNVKYLISLWAIEINLSLLIIMFIFKYINY